MLNFSKLLRDNINASLAARPQALIDSEGDVATVYIYAPIIGDQWMAENYGGISAVDLVPKLKAIKAKTIHVHIDSPGGDVFPAQAIAQALKSHPANVIAHVDGLAASAATVIALGADSIEMADGAFFMIHRAWTGAYGNANDLTKTANLLAQIDDSLAKTYADKTGETPAKMLAAMDVETWYSAADALEIGLIDSIHKSEKQAKAWALGAFKNAPAITPKSQIDDDGDDQDSPLFTEVIPPLILPESKAEAPKIVTENAPPEKLKVDADAQRQRQSLRLRMLEVCAP